MNSPAPRRHISLRALVDRLLPRDDEASLQTRDPIGALASMLDLPGSVRLAELSAELAPLVEPTHDSARLPSDFLHETEEGLATIYEQIPLAFESFRRPARMLRAIRAEEDGETAARALTERFEEAFARAIVGARTEIRALREELGERLKEEASPRGAALESLDAALILAIRGAMGARLAALVPEIASAFEEQALARLPSALGSLDLPAVEAFCRPSGWLGRAVSEGEAAVLAMVGLEGELVRILASASARNPVQK